MQDLFKTQLTSRRQRLVELLQRVNYGSVENLKIAGGDPSFEPKPTILRDFKFGPTNENGARPELAKANFRLKAALLQMFELFDQLGDGVIELLEVKAGLPFRIVIREQSAV